MSTAGEKLKDFLLTQEEAGRLPDKIKERRTAIIEMIRDENNWHPHPIEDGGDNVRIMSTAMFLIALNDKFHRDEGFLKPADKKPSRTRRKKRRR